jgi:hypothetical protein
MGYFLFGVSMETTDFFQNEAMRCRGNAKMATSKDDREFWLKMANRWETMQRITKQETPEAEAITLARESVGLRTNTSYIQNEKA